jgi:hypothetical protein
MYRALLFLFALQFSFSQSELKRALGEFNELKVYDGITVVLKKSNKNFLVISGENSQNVVVINKSGIMKVKMELFKRFNAENTTINIEHKSPVFLIESQQGSKIIIKDTIFQSTVYFKTSFGGQISAQLNVKKVRSISVSGGVIQITGRTGSHEAKAVFGGVTKASKLISDQTNANASSGGVCSAFGAEVFEATASLGGVVNVHGSPKSLTQSSFLSGQVIEKQINE